MHVCMHAKILTSHTHTDVHARTHTHTCMRKQCENRRLDASLQTHRLSIDAHARRDAAEKRQLAASIDAIERVGTSPVSRRSSPYSSPASPPSPQTPAKASFMALPSSPKYLGQLTTPDFMMADPPFRGPASHGQNKMIHTGTRKHHWASPRSPPADSAPNTPMQNILPCSRLHVRAHGLQQAPLLLSIPVNDVATTLAMVDTDLLLANGASDHLEAENGAVAAYSDSEQSSQSTDSEEQLSTSSDEQEEDENLSHRARTSEVNRQSVQQNAPISPSTLIAKDQLSGVLDGRMTASHNREAASGVNNAKGRQPSAIWDSRGYVRNTADNDIHMHAHDDAVASIPRHAKNLWGINGQHSVVEGSESVHPKSGVQATEEKGAETNSIREAQEVLHKLNKQFGKASVSFEQTRSSAHIAQNVDGADESHDFTLENQTLVEGRYLKRFRSQGENDAQPKRTQQNADGSQSKRAQQVSDLGTTISYIHTCEPKEVLEGILDASGLTDLANHDVDSVQAHVLQAANAKARASPHKDGSIESNASDGVTRTTPPRTDTQSEHALTHSNSARAQSDDTLLSHDRAENPAPLSHVATSSRENSMPDTSLRVCRDAPQDSLQQEKPLSHSFVQPARNSHDALSSEQKKPVSHSSIEEYIKTFLMHESMRTEDNAASPQEKISPKVDTEMSPVRKQEEEPGTASDLQSDRVHGEQSDAEVERLILALSSEISELDMQMKAANVLKKQLSSRRIAKYLGDGDAVSEHLKKREAARATVKGKETVLPGIADEVHGKMLQKQVQRQFDAAISPSGKMLQKEVQRQLEAAVSPKLLANMLARDSKYTKHVPGHVQEKRGVVGAHMIEELMSRFANKTKR
jgi:hypothetical protein